jgi:hypothetical protein
MQRILIIIASLSCIYPAYTAAAYYEEGALGKLLTTPAQRQKIDAFRKGKSIGVTREQISPTDVKVQGIVTRSDGTSTVWVNGKSTLEGSSVGGVDVKLNSINDQSDKVSIGINKKTVRLKPGQVWSEDSGKVTDSY